MNWLRSKWGARGVVALLLVCLLTVSFATAVHTARRTSSYAHWVRAQLRGPVDDAVLQALETASASRARSLEAFLAAFIEAFEAQQPEAPLAQALFALDLTNDALIAFLQSRYHGLVGDAVLPRVLLVAAQILSSHVSDRQTALQTVGNRHDLPYRRRVTTGRHAAAGPAVVLSLRVLSAAQPLGP